MEGLPMIDIKTAKTEELRKLFYATINAETLTDEQSKLLDDIVDELNEREGRSYTQENLNISYSYYLGQFNLTQNDLPEDAGRIDFILALLDKCTDEEFRRLRKMLSEQGNITDESKVALIVSDDKLSGRDADPPRAKPKPKYFRYALIAASIVFLLILVNITAQTLGFNFFGLFAKWTKDAVYFSDAEQADDYRDTSPAYEPLIMVLENHGIYIDLPKGIANGFIFKAIAPDKLTEFSPIIAWFMRGEDEFYIRITLTDENHRMFSEANVGEYAEVYKGQYHITYNIDRITAIWHQDIYEISISGNLTYEELTEMLDSI
jgi:hypothetical protein